MNYITVHSGEYEEWKPIIFMGELKIEKKELEEAGYIFLLKNPKALEEEFNKYIITYLDSKGYEKINYEDMGIAYTNLQGKMEDNFWAFDSFRTSDKDTDKERIEFKEYIKKLKSKLQ